MKSKGEFSVMIDIAKYRWWDEGIILVDGCSPCSLGCEHCWSAAQTQRFGGSKLVDEDGEPYIVENGKFTGEIVTHPERLTRFNTRKPKIFSIWNDLYHELVPDDFQYEVYKAMILNKQNTYLILTKRPASMERFLSPETCFQSPAFPHIWNGLTVCNQQEWDRHKDVFLSIPGKKFISHEPALEPILYGDGLTLIDCLISGGETGAGARPSHPDTFRKDRDQCAFYGVRFFFKQWGEWAPWGGNDCDFMQQFNCDEIEKRFQSTAMSPYVMYRIGRTKAGRLLDGKEWNQLPWIK